MRLRENDQVKHRVRGTGTVIKIGETAGGVPTYKVRFDRMDITDWLTERELELVRPQLTELGEAGVIASLDNDTEMLDRARASVMIGANAEQLRAQLVAEGLGTLDGADDIDWGEVFDHVADGVDGHEH
jgi:hypothetical protein